MKKINLIEWLYRNSHEKQKPQRFARYAAILIMLLTLGVGQMWAGNNCTYQNCYFYFNPYYDATHTVNKGSVQIAARKYQNVGGDDYGWYTAVTSLNNVTNTRLYYTSSFNGPNWSDAGLKFHGWAMISNSSAKSDGSTEYWKSGNSTWYSEFKNYGLNSSKTYLFEASSSSNGQTIETTTAPGYLSSGWSALNKTITVKAKISTNNGSSYSEATSPATLTASSYKFTAHNTCTTSTSLSSGSIVCGYTATTTLTAPSTDPTGYTWVGWYNASGTQQTTNKSLTIYPTANATYYAYYTANQYSGDIKKNGGAEDKTYTATYGTGTLTIASAPSRTGYQLAGYYDAAAAPKTLIANTSKALQNSTSYTTSGGKWNYTSAPDLYAGWTANTYTVRFHRNGGAGKTVYQNFTYDVAQNLTANSYTRTGYTFAGWALTTDGAVTYADGANVSNLTATNEGTYHLYAKWTPNPYTVVLDKQTSAEGYGGNAGTVGDQTVTFNATPATVSGTMPSAANGYAFMGFYSATGGNGRRFIDPSGNWVTSAGDTISGGKWVKPAGITLYAYYKKAEITGITFTDGAVVAPTTSKTVTAAIEPTPTGTTTVCWRVLYSNDNPLDPQPAFTPANAQGTSVSFTAPATSGMYKMEAVLHLGSGCEGEEVSTYVTTFQVAGDHTVTVQYKCGDETIAPSTTVTGRPLVWSEVVAHDIFGYTFSGWTAGDGITIEDAESGRLAELQAEDPTIVAVTKMKAIYDGRLTANYTQNQIIYFKNTLGWENVYVNFHTGNAWSNTDNGSGSPKGVGNSGLTNANKHMTRIGDTDVWYYDYGYNNGGSSISPSLYISFTDLSRSSASEFWGTNPGINVVYPANYADALSTDKSSENGFKAATPMFVPLSGIDPVAANVGGGGKANYYNRGYWTKYTAGTGYTLEIYYDDDASSCIQSIPFTSEDDLMPMSAVVDLEASTTYRYQVRRGGTSSAGIYYGNTGTMTYADHGVGTGWIMENTMAGGFKKAKITTNASGNYTFNLSYSPNASNEYRLRMEVDYPIADGDYRLIYTDATRDSGTRYKPSAIVTKANNSKDTVSFFVRPGSTPVLKIQQASVTKAGVITWGDLSDISSSVTSLPKDSVYNICLTMDGSGVPSVESVVGYTGNFYIRTNAAGASKWDNYRSSDHLMTYSEYSETYSDYTHYFMAYVGNGTNVKFVVANDYSPCISDTLVQSTFRGGDSYHVDIEGNIKADANVRFMWNRSNNAVYRAYLDKAKSDGSRFLVLRANNSADLMDADGNALLQASTSEQAGYNHGAPDNSIQFVDNENWIYETNVMVKPGAYVKLYAHFHDKDFYYRGNDNSSFDGVEIDGTPNAINLITGSGDAVKVRVVYDFKTDRLLAAWMPEGEIDDSKAINADVMFVREGQGDIAQLTFTKSGEITAIKTAYGVMKFNKWTLNNKDKDTHTVLSSPASIYERSLFWISFPFRVKLNEVFGFGTYGVDWAIQRYDGAERAEKGFWAESSGFWKWMDRNTEYLEPNQGYLLAIDLDLLGESASVWDNGVENVELYFPSYGTMPSITSAAVVQTLTSHQCEIDRSGESNGHGGTLGSSYNRTVIDSHWNVMSVPTYVNTASINFANTDWITEGDGKHGPNFLYTWNMDDNTLTPTAGAGYHYHAMHAYMVQYHGDVTWSASSGSPYSPIVARRTYAEQPKKVNFCLEIQQNEKMIDRTFVQLSDDEEVSAEFSFGEDMGKEFNSRKANIYTVIENYLPAAGNTLPMSDQTTLVPVGVKTTAAGEYSFAMPEGTNGVSVVLIDNIAGTRTNLALSDYTVTLGKGDLSDRFMLEIAPVKQMPTDVEEVTGDGLQVTGARKVIIDQKMFIIKDGQVFDARGSRVK